MAATRNDDEATMAAKPGTKSRWTIVEIDQVKDMLGRGLSQAEIAKAMATSQASISRLAAKLRESDQAINASVPDWDTIAANPAAWLREQPDMLTGLIRMQAAYDAKITSGPPGIDRPDWSEITRQNDAILAAYRAEKARREAG
jgi:hypothetical protein